MPNSNADKPNSRPLALSSCSLALIDSRASVLLLSDWSTRPKESCPIRLKELFESDLMLESDLSHSGLGLQVSCPSCPNRSALPIWLGASRSHIGTFKLALALACPASSLKMLR